MKLAALGVVTALIGLAVGVPGLIGIGAFWVALGPVVRMHGQRIESLRASASGAPATSTEGGAETATGKPVPVIDGRTFAIGTLLWLVLGIPSLAVGVLEIGISGEDEAWRWLPIVVGGLALGIGVTSAALYLAGSAVLAVADSGPERATPATLWIRSVRETGTFINERPRLEFELHVEPDDGTGVASYDVTKLATVPFTAMASLRVGDGFRAMVAGPDDPTAMDIGWDEPVAGTPAPDVSARLEALDRLQREDRISTEEYDAQRARILGSI